MNLKYVDKPKELIETAFARGRKASSNYKEQKTRFYTIKGKEIARVDASGEYLIETLSNVAKEFPSVDKLAPFYRDLFTSIIDVAATKKALSSISSVSKLIKKRRIETIIKIKELRYEKGNDSVTKSFSNAYFGRICSLVKGLEKPIEVYDAAVKKLRELPSIKTDEEVYILAGLPNVGKSTLLGKITSSKPKVAAYPFTTQGLNVGSFEKKFIKIQVIDTPGLLDRPLFERNKIELKAIAAFQHLKGTVIFVVDPLDDMTKQKNLFLELKKLFTEKGFIIVINKTDIASPEMIKNAQKAFEGNYLILEGNGLNNLKDEMMK
jgi:nucleolar GTP-binding protein